MDKIPLSIEEAEALIPYIKKDVTKLIRINKSLSLINSIEIKYKDDYKTLTSSILLNKKFHKLSYEFFCLFDKLRSKGCIVKDPEIGLVDFYSLFEGREIFLCWKLGENKITCWHEVGLGYKSRKPVSMIQKELKNK